MRSPRWLPVLVLAVALPLLAGTAVVMLLEARSAQGGRSAAPREETQRAAASAAPPLVVARTVLGAWDERRAQAWASGDPGALGELYAPGSAAGRRDVAMLRAWTGRGLVVEGLDTQVLRLVVRRARAGRLVLDVTDRVVGATAVGRTGTRLALPADRPTRRVLVLRRGAGEWRMVTVRPVSRAGAATR